MSIAYTEKGRGLHEAVAAAGYQLWEVVGVGWKSTNDAAVQPIIDGYTLAQAQASKSADVDAQAKTLRDKVVAGYSPGELASWSVKLAEVEKYAVTGLATDAPMLSAEATARGVTLAALISKVQANYATFRAIEAQIAGNSGKHRDAINALTTFAQVISYDFSAGWPVV